MRSVRLKRKFCSAFAAFPPRGRRAYPIDKLNLRGFACRAAWRVLFRAKPNTSVRKGNWTLNLVFCHLLVAPNILKGSEFETFRISLTSASSRCANSARLDAGVSRIGKFLLSVIALALARCPLFQSSHQAPACDIVSDRGSRYARAL